MSDYVRYVKQPVKFLSPRLGSLDIELTERCNNNCIHCCINLPENDDQAKTREMSTEQVKTILTEAVNLGCLTVRFTGGEPLLRPDFADLYIFARSLGLKVMLFTNARLITPQLADLLARTPPLEKIEISVYGMHPESYEAVSRAPGSFAQFRQGVDLLLERDVPFIVKAALLPPNRGEMEEYEAWAEKIPGMDHEPYYVMLFDLRRRRDDLVKNQMIESLRLTPEEVLCVLTSDEKKYRQGIKEFAKKFMRPAGDKIFHCGIGQVLCVDPYGYAQPCLGVRAPQFSINVISPNSEAPLANALEYYATLREMRSKNPEYLMRCAQCFLKGLCGQCPGKSWTENGTFDTPVEYFCAVAHAQARHMGWLKENEKAWTVQGWRKRVFVS